MTISLKRGIGALILAATLVLAASANAATAAPPCWQQVFNEWLSGEITHVYPLDCYRTAISQLPNDLKVYSSAREDITRALQDAIKYEQQKKDAEAAVAAGKTPTVAEIPVPKIKTRGPGKASLLGLPNSASKDSGGSSLPLPLIILGALAILLVGVGGAGLLVRRIQERRRGA